jgi:glycosyltransferase involved in cell wall biosynthesis
VVRSGWLAPPELSAYLLAGDVALLPCTDGASARRGSLLACAEHGLPIVSTIPATRSVSDAVLAVTPQAGALADAVLEVAETNALRQRLQAASQALAARTSWPGIAETHVRIYKQTLI